MLLDRMFVQQSFKTLCFLDTTSACTNQYHIWEVRKNMIEKGQKAINFSLKNQMNLITELADFHGRKVFLFFFPKVDSFNDQAHLISVAK